VTTTTTHKFDSPRVALLRAQADLADSIVRAAGEQLDQAAQREDRGLYEGCVAALSMRRQEAREARAKLIAAATAHYAQPDVQRLVAQDRLERIQAGDRP
jgi:hypothetical protein